MFDAPTPLAKIATYAVVQDAYRMLSLNYPELLSRSIGEVLARLQPDRHSADYSWVRWYGHSYDFSPSQAAVVRLLWEARLCGIDGLRQDTILESVDSVSGRLKDLFRRHPAWGTMIVTARGRVKLQEPPDEAVKLAAESTAA